MVNTVTDQLVYLGYLHTSEPEHIEGDIMQLQKKMEQSFLAAHRDFVTNLASSIEMIEKDISDAKEMQQICTDEWCMATEHYLDELGKAIFSISEPRFASDEDSKKIRDLRNRIHDLYANYKSVSAS